MTLDTMPTAQQQRQAQAYVAQQQAFQNWKNDQLVKRSAAYWRSFLADNGPQQGQPAADQSANKTMSGYRLRALLEDQEFCNNLANGGNAQLGLIGLGLGAKEEDKKSNKLSSGVYNPTSASLLRNNNIWDDAGPEDDFNLEYMDLDEFLSETGLVDDQHFASLLGPNSAITAPSPQNQPQQDEEDKSPKHQLDAQKVSSLEKLLLEGGDSSVPPPDSPASSEGGVVSVAEATQQILPTTVVEDSDTDSPVKKNTVKLTADKIVKKRKYSEDGEGLTETSVVVVPGSEGFDPSAAKFAPEELQPQPIIKKSKKQFVLEANKDEKYWKRRNKNNVAAKRSREARRAKENQIIMRAGFLESENERLTEENEDLLSENAKLRKIIEDMGH